MPDPDGARSTLDPKARLARLRAGFARRAKPAPAFPADSSARPAPPRAPQRAAFIGWFVAAVLLLAGGAVLQLRRLTRRAKAAPAALPADFPSWSAPPPAPERAGSTGRLIAALLLVGAAAVRLGDPLPVAQLRVEAFDAYQRLWPRAVGERRVVIVDIDEASLREIGQWPWPRSLLADLVGRLLDAGAAAIALDINIAEPDRLSAPALADSLPGLDPASREILRRQPDNDALLARAIGRGPVVLAAAVLPDAPTAAGASGGSDGRPAIAAIGADPRRFLPEYPGLLRTLPELEAAAQGVGINSFSADRDGVLRRMPLLFHVDGGLHPALVVELIRAARGDGVLTVRADEAGIEAVAVGGIVVPTDAQGGMRPYFAPPGPDGRVSAAAVLAGAAPASAVAGRLVLVGSSATGLKDLRATPVAEAMAGVEVLAQAVEAMLSGQTLRRPRAAPLIELAALLGVGALVLIVVPRLGALANIALSVGLAAVLAGGSVALFLWQRALIDWTFPVVAVSAINILLVFMKYADERRARRVVHRHLLLVQQEMTAAREVQRAMLPATFPRTPTLQVYAEMWPAREVGGDFYDTFELPEGRLGFAIGDVAGKGMPAALFMALARTVLRAHAPTIADAGGCLERVNDVISADNQAQLFVTVFYGIADPATGRVVYANGGHNPPYLCRADGGIEPVPSTDGLALGVLDGFPYATGALDMVPGDTLLLYTDGVTEAFDPAGREFGDARLADLLRATKGRAAEPLVGSVVRDVRGFMAGAAQADDITCLALTYVGGAGAGVG